MLKIPKDYLIRAALPRMEMLEGLNHVGRALVKCIIL